MSVNSVSFNTISNYDDNNTCNICSEPLKNQEVVAHSGIDGTKHPIHKECIKNWIKKSPTCPICRKTVKVESLLSTKEILIIKIKIWCSELLLATCGIATGILVSKALEGPNETDIILTGRIILGAVAGTGMSIILESAWKAISQFCEALNAFRTI
ncbi:MAG: RING finger domain-containing protein [Parachlamydiales bacterium]